MSPNFPSADGPGHPSELDEGIEIIALFGPKNQPNSVLDAFFIRSKVPYR
jgi:hypothetical protein